MTDYSITTLSGGSAAIGAEDLAGIRGRIVGPRDDDFDEVRAIWNAMIDRRPGLIIQATGTADVQAAVRLANKHDLLISVRGGGHNIAGSATCDGGLMIDLSNMRAVRVFPEESRVSVQGGALLGDMDHETAAFGLAVPSGINSTTGVGGLALGGGFGWLSRKYCHAADNIIGMDVVTPDGSATRASETENPDLFWALRGGSGNFGVVTCFDFRCHPIPPQMLTGLLVHPIEDATEVMAEYDRVARSLPDEAVCWGVARKAPPLPFVKESDHGRLVFIMAMTYVGDPAEGEKVMAPLQAIGNPIAQAVGPAPFTAWQAAFDPLLTPGARNYWKSHDLMELNGQVIARVIAAINKLPDDQCEIFFGQVGGAAGRVAVDAIAFPHRAHSYTMNVHARWSDPAKDDACIGWARDVYSSIAPYSTGGVYVNFIPDEEPDRTVGPFGANEARLQKIKAAVDPQNRFRTNVNIKPMS